ncbi:MAG: glycosyltransferase family 2 protein [Duncaniella sp.]|nr:glycosyltransferase family 2 protein [Duncaniella sp.]
MYSPLAIVIPVYNRAHTIMRTLRSIDEQTLRPAQVILVDNNSTDNSMAIISAWAKGKGYATVLSEPSRGACAARNCGLREVTAPWTMFFDSDDVMHPTHVSDFSRAIASHPEADIIGRDILTHFIDGSHRRLYFRAGSNAMFHHLFRGCLSTQRYVARTSLFHTVGGWDESLSGWNDYELGTRLLMHTSAILQLSGSPTVTTFQQEESITGLSFSAHPERWERSLDTIRNHFLSLPGSDSRRRRWLDWLDARCMILAAAYEHEALDTSHTGPEGSAISHTLSASLYATVMQRTPHPHRQRLIYLHNLHLRRLTWLLAKSLL